MRYHVIYSVIYIIMYLARGQGDLYSFRNRKNQLELESQGFPFLKSSNTMLKNLTKDLEEISSSEFDGRNVETPFSTRHSSRKNPKNKKGYLKSKNFTEKEEKNFIGSGINLEKFNVDNFLRSPGFKEVDTNFSLVSSRDIVSNSSFLEGNPQKFYEKYSSLKIDDGNSKVSKAKRRKSNENGDQNFESKKKQQVEDVLIPEWMDQKGFRRKREISYLSKPRSRKRRFTNQSRKEARENPSRVGRHQIIRLVRDQQAQNSTGKETSNSKNSVSDKKNENSVSRSNNQSPQENKSKINNKVQSQSQLPSWQVQEPAAPISQGQGFQINQNKTVNNQKNLNNQVSKNLSKKNEAPLSNSQNLNSRNQVPLMKDVAPPFPSQDKILSSSSGSGRSQIASNNLKLNSEFQERNYSPDLATQNLENSASLEKKLLLNSVPGNSFEKLNENVLPLEYNPLLQNSLSVSNNLGNVDNLGNLNTAVFNSNLRNSNPNLIGEGTLSGINYLNNPISNYKLSPQQVLLQQRGQRTLWPSSNDYFNFGDKTSDLLSFKAHLHHKVRDIGKRFLQDASNNMNPNQLPDQNLNQFNEQTNEMNLNQFSDPNLNQFNDRSIELSNNNLDTSNLYGLNQPSSGTNINLPNQSNNLSLYNPYSSGLLENVPLLNPLYNIPAQGFLNPYNNFMNSMLENGYLYNGGPIYNPNLLNPSVPLFQEPYLGNPYNNSLQNLNYFSPPSVQNDPNIIRPVYLQREGRSRGSPFRLKYLDNYSKAINNLENSESEKVLDNSDQSNFMNSKSASDNFGNTNQLESSVSDLHDVADGLEEKGSSYQSDLFEYPFPYYIPQKFLRSNNREDAVISSGVVTSNVVSNGVERKSFSSVVEPLTEQLQKLLATLKNMNENLMNGKDKSQRALQETELVDTPRKKRNLTRVKRNSMGDEHSLDLDKNPKSSENVKPSFLVDGKTLEQDRKLEESLLSEPNYNKIDDNFAVEKSIGNKTVDGPSTDASNQFKGGKTDLKTPTKNDVPKITSIEEKVPNILPDKQESVITTRSFTTINSIKNIFAEETTTMKPEIEEIQLWSTSSDIRFNLPTTVNRTSDVKNKLENAPSSPRSTSSSALELDILQDKSQKIHASILNFDDFLNYNQDPKIGSSSQIKNVSSGKEMKILGPVMDINVSNFFSELENLAHDTKSSSNDQFTNYSKISQSQFQNPKPAFEQVSNLSFPKFQNALFIDEHRFMDFDSNNPAKKIFHSKYRQRNATDTVKKLTNFDTDLSKDVFTKVIRKRSSPEYKPESENDNDNDDNNSKNFENQNTFREKKRFDSSFQNQEKVTKCNEDKLENNCNGNKVIENGAVVPCHVENQQRWMDHKNIQSRDKIGLFSIFEPTNLMANENQKSKIISDIKGRKLNDNRSAAAKNVQEIKFLVNKQPCNQVSEPIKDVNLKHNEGQKHRFAKSISKRGINKLIKKSELGSTYPKKHKEDKHIKMIKSKPKLSTWDLKTKSSKKGKKHSKGGKNSRKGRKKKNKNRRNLRRIKSTFSDPEAHIYGRNKIKRKSKEGKKTIFESANRVRKNFKLDNTIQRVEKNFPMKKQEYSEENNCNEDKKDFSSKAKISRLENSLEDNDQSDERKYDKPGYARLGRRLQSSTTDDLSTEEYDYQDVEYYTDKGMLTTETYSEEEEDYEEELEEEEGVPDGWSYIPEYDDTTEEMSGSTNNRIEEAFKLTKTSEEVTSETKIDTTTKVNPEMTNKVETGVTTEAVTSETVKSDTNPQTTTVQPVASTAKVITEITNTAVTDAATEVKIETTTEVKPEKTIKVEIAVTTEAMKSVTVPQTTTVQTIAPTTKVITEITTKAVIEAATEPKIETTSQVNPETIIKVEPAVTEAMTSETVKSDTVPQTTTVQSVASTTKATTEITTKAVTEAATEAKIETTNEAKPETTIKVETAVTTEMKIVTVPQTTTVQPVAPTNTVITGITTKAVVDAATEPNIQTTIQVNPETIIKVETAVTEAMTSEIVKSVSVPETTVVQQKESSSKVVEEATTIGFTLPVAATTEEVTRTTEELPTESTLTSETKEIIEVSEGSTSVMEESSPGSEISTSEEISLAAPTTEFLEETTETAEETSSSEEETSKTLEETTEAAEETSEVAKETSETVEEITEVSEITSISEEETLEVVEETTEAEQGISSSAEETSETVEETTASLKITSSSLEEISETAETSTEGIEATSEAIEETTTQASEVSTISEEETSEAVEEMTEFSKITSSSVEEISDTAERSTEDTEKTSEAIEETTAALEKSTQAPEETSGASKETTISEEETSWASEETSESVEETTEAIEITSSAKEETSETVEVTTETVEMTSSAKEETSEAEELTSSAKEETPETEEDTSEAREETSEAAEETSEGGEEISETVEETSEGIATIEAERVTSSSIEETTQETAFEDTSEFLTGTTSTASEYLTIQEGETQEFSSSSAETTASSEVPSEPLSATVVEGTESTEILKTTESLKSAGTTEALIPTSEEIASEITKEVQILTESEATETLVTESTISMESTEFEQKTFTASPETTSKLEISATTENETTERTEATPEGTIVVEITEETTEQQETITPEGLLTSFDTGPTTEKESQVSETESSVPVPEISSVEEITTSSLESSTNEKGSSLSATGTTIEAEESLTTHAEEIEEPKVESSTELNEEGEFEEVYDEEFGNKTKDYDEEYDYEDEGFDKAAHEINGTEKWYDYEEDQFSTSEGQSEAEITTKETTEYEISLETEQNKTEESSSKNAEETTATPGLMVESSSFEELSSESVSGSIVEMTSKSGLTLETLPDTGLDTSSSKHETSILTEITSGFSYESTTVKEDYKTENKGEMKTNLEMGGTSTESLILSEKEKEEEERKKKIEEDLKKFEEKEKKILEKGEKEEKTTNIVCEAATETPLSFTDTGEMETSLESEITTAESSTHCGKEKEEEKKILEKEEKEEKTTKISSEATTETSNSLDDTEGMKTSLESEVTTIESSTHCGKEKEEKKILEKEEKGEKMTKISSEATTETSNSIEDTEEMETSSESGVPSTESSILCGKEKEEEGRKKKIEVDLNKLDEKKKKILVKEKEEKTNKINCEATTETLMSLRVTSKIATIVSMPSKETTTSAIPTTQIRIPSIDYTKTLSITPVSCIPSTSLDLEEQKKQKESEEKLKKIEKSLDMLEKELAETREKIKEEERRKLEEIEQRQKEFEEKQTQLEERQKEMEEETKEVEAPTVCDNLSEEEKEEDKGEEEEKDEDNNGKYVFDEDEEVWKNVRPDGFDQEIDRNKIDYAECSIPNRAFSSEMDLSPVTERICLNVLKDSKSKEVLTNREKDIVTKFANMPLVPKDLSSRQNAKRLARKLMNLSDKSSGVKNSQILKKYLNSNLKRSKVEDTTLTMSQWVVDENGYRIETTNVDRLEDHEWTEGPPQKSKFLDHVDKKCLLQRNKRDFSWKKFWNCLTKSSETTTTKRVLVMEPTGSNFWPPQNEQNCEVETLLEQKLYTTEGYSAECLTIPPPTEDNSEKEYPVEDEVEDLEPSDIEDDDEEEEEEGEEDEKPGDENLELNDCKEKGVESATLETSEPKEEEETSSGFVKDDEKETEEEEDEDEGFYEEYEEPEDSWTDYETDKGGTEEKTEKTLKEENFLKESKEEQLRDKEIELISNIENLKREQDTLKEDILRGKHLKRILKAVPKTSSITKDFNERNIFKRESIQKVEQIGEDHFNDASSNEEYNNFESRVGFKHRKPPGSKWPTERPEKYHVGGSQIWDREYSCNPILNCSLLHKTAGKRNLKRIERSLSKSSDTNSISSINKYNHQSIKSPIQAFYKSGSDKFSRIRDGPFYEFLGEDEDFTPDETKNTKFHPNIDNEFQKLSKNDLPIENKKSELEFSKKKVPVLDFSEKLSLDSNLDKAMKLAVDIVIAEATKILNDESRIIRTDDVENKFLRKLKFPGKETIDSLLNPESNLAKKKEENIMKATFLKKRSNEIQDVQKTKINETSTTLNNDIFQNNSSNELKSTSDNSNLSLHPDCSSTESTSISSTSGISSSDNSSNSENSAIISSETSSVISPAVSSISENSTDFPGQYFICVPVINSKQNQSNIPPPELGTPNNNYFQRNNQVNFPTQKLMVENNMNYNLVNPTGGLNENKKREILRLKNGKEEEEIKLEESRLNQDIYYDEKNNDDYENDYEDILDDESFGRSLLGFKKNANSKAHGNKKGLNGKKPQKEIKGHKKNKDRKNQKKGKNLKGERDHKKRRYHKNEKFLHSKTPKNKKSQEIIKVHEITKPKSSQMSKIVETDVSVKKEKYYNVKKMNMEKGKNDHTQEKKLSVIEKAELAGPASISPIKNSKSGTNTNNISKSNSEQITKEETDHLLDKVLEMINNQNAADLKGRKNCKVSEKNRVQNVIEQKRRLSRSIIDKVKEMIGHAIGYSKTPEKIQEKKIPILEEDFARIRSRTRKPKLKSKKRRKKLKRKRHRKPNIFEHEKITSLKSKAVSSENNFNSMNNGKNHDNKVSFQGSANGELNIESSNQDSDQQKKIVFKNKSQFSNVKNIIPKVKELVDKQNLGNVDKIIVYVDKDEMKKGSKLELNRVNNLDSSFGSGGQTIKSENLSGKKNSPRSKHLKNSQASINGVSLDEIVSLAVDKVLKSINLLNSPGTPGSPSSDDELFVKVVQPVAYETEIPHDEMKTEFTIDLSKFGKIYKPDYPGEDKLFGSGFLVENRETQIKKPFHETSKNLKLEENYLSEKKKNFNFGDQVGVKIKQDSKDKSKRFIQHKNCRKMNLPVTPFKRRRFWYEKMKKDEKLDKENLAQIRRDIMKELNKKFKEAEPHRYSQNREEIIRDKRKISNEELEKVKKIKNHAHSSIKSNINEKIKILYALHHNKNLHTKSREAKEHSNLRRHFSNRKGVSKKLEMVAKMKDSKSKEAVSSFGEEAQEKMLKKKRMVQEFSENSAEEQDSGKEKDFSYNREFRRPRSKISRLDHKNQMNDNFVENNDQNDMFDVEDYDQEARDFGFRQSNGTDVKNISNINFQNSNASYAKQIHNKKILTENSRSKNEKIENREMHKSRKIKSLTSPEIKSSINSNFEFKVERNPLRTRNNLDRNQIESEDISKDDSNYFQHIIDLQKQLLRRSKSHQTTSLQNRNTLNQFSKEKTENLEDNKIVNNTLTDLGGISESDDSPQEKYNNHILKDKTLCQKCNFCLDKYNKIKNLIHAGSHLLPRRFDHCVNCHTSCPKFKYILTNSSLKNLEEKRKHFSKTKELEGNQPPDQETQNMTEKIFNFAREVGETKKKIRNVGDIQGLHGEVDKFEKNELVLTDEGDRKTSKSFEHPKKKYRDKKLLQSLKLNPENGKTQKERKIHKRDEKINKKKSQSTKSAAKTSKENIKNLRMKKNLDEISNYEDESNQDIFGEKHDIKEELVGFGKPLPILNSRFKKDVQNLENETPNILKKKDKSRENINLDKGMKYKSRRMQSINENNFQYEEKILDRKLIDARNSNNLQAGESANIICEFENRKVFETTTKILFHLLNITACAKSDVPDNYSLEHINSEDIGLKNPKIFLSSEENFNEVDDNQSIERNEKYQDFQKRLIGRQLCSHKSPNKNKHSTQRVKNQNSQKVKVKKNKKKNHIKHKKGTKKIKHIHKKKTKSKTDNNWIKKASSNRKIKKSNYKNEESENVNSKKENYQSQTVIPIQDGKIRVKYIFRDNMNDLENNRDIRGLDFQGNKKDEGAVEKKRQENCETCICDLNQAVLDLRNMLGKRNNLLGKIKTYQCNLYTDIGNEVSITNGPFDAIGELRRDLEKTRGLKYVESEKVEYVLKRGIENVHEHDIFSLPGFNLNVPCNHEGEDITWMMSISRPNYTWIREDGSPISGVVRKNGNLELYDVDTKDTGNYSCIVNYIDPENEEPVKNIYKHNVQVVTLPRYALRGGNRYKLEACDDSEIEVILTYLPKKLNEILCEKDICEAYIFTPHCHREQIAINVLVVPSNTAKLVPVGLNQCGIRCRKAVQDKIALLLSRNLRAVLRRPIVFRLPHHREKLVPIRFSKRKRRHKRGPNSKYKSVENVGEVGLLIGCPAGYNLRDTHCLPCLPSFYSEDGSSHCKKCPLGTHQPNTGARTCQACTNPFVEGCHEMIWNSSAAIIILAIIIFIVILALSMVLCLVKCARKNRINETCARITAFEPKNEDGAKNSLLRFKKKRKQNDDKEIILLCNETKKKSGRDRPDRKSDRSGYAPVSCADSYRSYEGYDENYSTRKSSRHKYKPPVPAPDFDI